MNPFANFEFNYVYRIELLTILAVVIIVLYVWYALDVFKKE